MKKIIVFMFILPLIGTDIVGSEVNNDELLDLTHVAEDIGLTNMSWEVTIKEKIPKAEIENNLDNMPKNFHITDQVDDQIITYSINDNANNNDLISVSYTAVVPQKSNTKGEWTATISGENWNEETRLQYKEIRDTNLAVYFSQNAHKYTCLEGYTRDILNKVPTIIDQLENKLNIVDYSTHNDTIKNKLKMQEVYGYTPNWTDEIMISDKPMNLHIAFIPQENSEDKIIIGTPILINEY